MAVEQVQNQAHIPAWKRLGLKLKNSSSMSGQPDPSTPAATTAESTSNKRKAADIIGASEPSHDQLGTLSARSEGKRANAKPKERPSKRKKSVSFVDGTKNEDGDINEKLLEDYVARQQGGQDQFSKAEIAQFTSPALVRPANQPSTKVDSTASPDAKGVEKKEKQRKKRVDTSNQPQHDTAYIAYLKEYRSSRATWKFNKNHQTKLLQNLYNTYRIPNELDDALSLYLSGLQGEATRKRLAEAAAKVILETNDLEGVETIMLSQVNLAEAKDKALKAQLKQKKSIVRNMQAAEEAYSEEHQEKLRRRKRATVILQSLRTYPSPSSEMGQGSTAPVSQNDDDLDRPAKRKKSRRSRKMKTGVPDDDDTDETSSVSSVPSPADSEDEGEDSSGSDSSSTASSTSAGDSSSESSAGSESESESEGETG